MSEPIVCYKRLNPKTGLHFKRGDLREDGFIFFHYRKTIDVNGYNHEDWRSPESYKKYLLDNNGPTRTLNRVVTILLNAAKRRAKLHGAKCTLTQEWIREKLLQGCAISKRPFNFAGGFGASLNPHAPSIDRIDNKNREYTPENCQIICFALNIAKGPHSDNDLLPLMEAFVVHLRESVAKSGTDLSVGASGLEHDIGFVETDFDETSGLCFDDSSFSDDDSTSDPLLDQYEDEIISDEYGFQSNSYTTWQNTVGHTDVWTVMENCNYPIL
jgi:hypothetical protein